MPAVHHDLVSFDLDGTLVDTAAEIAEAACRALEDHGIARRPVPEIVAFIGHGTRELILRLLERVFQEQPGLAATVRAAEVLARMDHHYALTTGTSAAPYPGVVAALRRLDAAGVKLACVTNKESRHAHRMLEVTGLDTCFALTIGGDTLPQKKPDPSVLQYVVGALGGERSRAAHVGDSSIDVQAARNAGVAAWAVPYGYNGGAPISAANPDRLFAGIPEVAEFVLAASPGG